MAAFLSRALELLAVRAVGKDAGPEAIAEWMIARIVEGLSIEALEEFSGDPALPEIFRERLGPALSKIHGCGECDVCRAAKARAEASERS